MKIIQSPIAKVLLASIIAILTIFTEKLGLKPRPSKATF